MGSFDDEIIAAKVYDISKLQTQGFDAMTNFNYSKCELL